MPDLNISGIIFNGDADTGDQHETFWIAKNDVDWTFCKTARKPYDLLVVGVLCAAKDILKYDTSTDGDFEDWFAGIGLYVETMYDGVLDKDMIISIVPEKFQNIEFEVKHLN